VKKNRRKASSSHYKSSRLRKPRRNLLVLVGLLGSLSATSILLLAIAPAPLAPEAHNLFVLQRDTRVEALIETGVPLRPDWRYIYIHHSGARNTRAASEARDHFIVCDSDTGADGEIQVGEYWVRQQSFQAPGLNGADNCISICVSGNLDQSPPSQAQLDRLRQLVHALQRRFGVPASGVVAYETPGSSAGIGHNFPAAQFSQTLLP
jgi:hypothetical protein